MRILPVFLLNIFLLSISVSCGVQKSTKQIYKKDGSLYAIEKTTSVLVKTKKIDESKLVIYTTPNTDLFFEQKDILRMVTNTIDKAKCDSLMKANHIISLNPDFSLKGFTQKLPVNDLISLLRKGKVRIQIRESKRFVPVFRFEENTINESRCVYVKDEYGEILFEYKGCSYPMVEYP